ncbi:MAG: pilus assembly protein TadG-related protein [Rhodobacteraceae bacterium]|nr:pilus assembly protein TadG-related protein [Paracoccaceae bacterium]
MQFTLASQDVTDRPTPDGAPGPGTADKATIHDLVGRYRREEDGALMVFGLYVFIIIVMVAGLAVDMMWFESRRATLQATLDRAILAAADLNQTLDPEGVVEDYFTKAGLREFLIDVNVDEGLNFREVDASAATEFPTFFMHWTGVESLTAPALGTALERITDVEVSLVVDFSGSMNQNNRIQNLKGATGIFFDMLYADPEAGENISVSVVPYATQVSVGPLLLDRMNFQRFHTHSNCAELPTGTFGQTAISPTAPLAQAGHFDRWSSWNWSYDPVARWDHIVCPVTPTRNILPYGGDRVTLQNHVNAMIAGGNTSIDLGAKWGVALLDPAFRPVAQDLIDDGLVPEAFEGRPFDFRTENVMKVLVLMTDGENTEQPVLRTNRTTQLSGIWRWQHATNAADVRWSFDSREGPGTDRDGDGVRNERYFHPFNAGANRWTNDIIGGTGGANPAVEQTWQQIWAQMHVNKWAYDFHFRQRNNADDYHNAVASVYTELNNFAPARTKDGMLDQVCNAAKAQEIIIFTIGFEVTDRSAGVMQRCASTDSHFFRASGRAEIERAFRSIASTINRLRLTQ